MTMANFKGHGVGHVTLYDTLKASLIALRPLYQPVRSGPQMKKPYMAMRPVLAASSEAGARGARFDPSQLSSRIVLLLLARHSMSCARTSPTAQSTPDVVALVKSGRSCKSVA